MKLGGFGKLNDYEKIKSSGYDFAELDLPEITDLDEDSFEKLVMFIHEAGYPVLTGARLFPLSEPYFFTEQYDAKKVQTYLKKCCMRAEKTGIKKVILGNGKARWLPEEKSKKEELTFIDAVRIMAEITDTYHLELIIEPLGPRYSNYINTIPEAVDLIEKSKCKNVYTMADLRHMIAAEESFQDIINYKEMVHHIHIDYPLSFPERRYPDIKDDYNYENFLDAVYQSGYDDTLTVEADIPENWNMAFQQAKACIRKYSKLLDK